MKIMQTLQEVEFTILDNAVNSDHYKTNGLLLMHVITDAVIDATSLKIQVAPDVDGVPGTFVDLEDGAGVDVAVTVATSMAALVSGNRSVTPGPWMRFVADTTQTTGDDGTVIKAYFREA